VVSTGPPASAACSCGFALQGEAARPRPESPVASCWICGGDEFYVQKDFNRKLGLWIVLTSFLGVFLVMLLVEHRVGIYCLVLLALIDAVAYARLPNVTVCYLCQSIYRGFPLNPAHRGFYLGLEEKYKKLRAGWLDSLLRPR
jgi:hypothetical protein